MKKGQVAVFMIVGLVLVIIVILLFILNSQNVIDLPMGSKDVNSQLNVKMGSIENKINDCIEEEGEAIVQELISNAGVFNSVNYITYMGNTYGILCTNIKDSDKCVSSPVILSTLKEKIDNAFEERLTHCVEINKFGSSDTTVTAKSIDIDTTIEEDNIFIKLNYPVTLTKDETTKTVDTFVHQIDVPLGAMVDSVNDILNTESEGLNFDPLAYGLQSMSKKVVVVHRPYPHKTFDVFIEGYEDYKFLFAVEGESRFE